MTIEDIRKLKKAELHVHLNGLFETSVIQDVLKREKTIIPFNFNLDKDLNILHGKRSLLSYLKPWEVLRLMPTKIENLSKLINNAFDSLVKENIDLVELRSSVIYLSLLLNMRIEETLIVLISELTKFSEKHAVKYGLILTITRGDYSMSHLLGLMRAYENIGRPKEIVGLDLAGNEDYIISEDLGRVFRHYKDKHHLGITIHAGETGNIDNVRKAIFDFDADRIGHGTAAGKCSKTMEILSKKSICVEICPISNRRTGAIKAEEAHPAKKFIDFDVPFVICSDNPGIHKATLSNDYFDFYSETANFSILKNMYDLQMKFSFIK